VKFLVDNQFPGALSKFLSSRDCDCIHVMDVGLAQASDHQIWRYACEKGRAVITKDEDFLHLSVREPQTALIWVRLGNCRTPKLLAEFDRLWPRILASLKTGDRVIEIR
jgi:predicted nuclease of predicted toxin-antitoxin system